MGPYDLSNPLSESRKEGELFPLCWFPCMVETRRGNDPIHTRGDTLSAVPPSVFVIVVTVVVRVGIVSWKEE